VTNGTVQRTGHNGLYTSLTPSTNRHTVPKCWHVISTKEIFCQLRFLKHNNAQHEQVQTDSEVTWVTDRCETRHILNVTLQMPDKTLSVVEAINEWIYCNKPFQVAFNQPVCLRLHHSTSQTWMSPNTVLKEVSSNTLVSSNTFDYGYWQYNWTSTAITDKQYNA